MCLPSQLCQISIDSDQVSGKLKHDSSSFLMLVSLLKFAQIIHFVVLGQIFLNIINYLFPDDYFPSEVEDMQDDDTSATIRHSTRVRTASASRGDDQQVSSRRRVTIKRKNNVSLGTYYCMMVAITFSVYLFNLQF
jgi:hypothetical protein